ncbi:adenosylcobinamide-GDP ribazoletransferase [Nocardia sp. NPDC050406]|uniref:adenosylcobinamide-GDP ribazoletransferase n=1 Tax=Nocardia sp. NPDC050406 TaxID=3364318 RepID=UPI0037A20ADD
MNGVRLAMSWLTVLPVRGPEAVDRAAGARAIGWAPLVGALIGVGAACLMWLLGFLGASSLLAGFVGVAALALVTRGMHVDGLADTMDGLGSYGPPERAREIMKSGGVGPFGVAALVFALGIQAVSFAALVENERWLGVVVAVLVGRVAVVFACRRGIDAAPGAGFGALVAGTQRPAVRALWAGIAAVAAGFATDQWWLGPIAVLMALGSATVLVQHCVRRFGGLNGDVLGAALELAVTIAAAVLTLRP